MNRLATSYLGLRLRSPLVPSASPLTMELATLRRLEAAGAGAVVLGSLFAEQIEHDAAAFYAHHEQLADSFAEAQTFLPAPGDWALGPHEYLEHVRRAKQALSIPVIASLNAGSLGSWIEFADLLEKAGADALELNVYTLATDPEQDGRAIEQELVEIVREVRAETALPLAVKLSPYYSALPALAQQLVAAGAGALVLFNRFYQPDFDLEDLRIDPSLELSQPYEGRLALRWLAILFGRAGCQLAATTGIHSSLDALKAIAAGADVAMLCSALLRHGPDHLRVVHSGIETWLGEHDYDSVAELRGSLSQGAAPDRTALERANYMRVLTRYH